MNYSKSDIDQIKKFFSTNLKTLLSYVLLDSNLDSNLSIEGLSYNLRTNLIKKKKRKSWLKIDENCDKFSATNIPFHGNFFVTKKAIEKQLNEKYFNDRIYLGLLDVEDEYLWKNKEKISWSNLSANKNLFWSEKRIARFKNYINFYSLSNNCNVEFNKNTLEKYPWHANGVSGNPSISNDLLFWLADHHPNKIIWATKLESGFYSGLDSVHYDYKGYSKAPKYRDCKPFYIKPSLSTNPNLQIDNSNLNFHSILDLWQVARHGNFSKEFLKKMVNSEDCILDENRPYKTVFTKYSDWRNSYVEYRNGWINLFKNPNIFFDDSLLKALGKRKTVIVEMTGNARSGHHESHREISLINLVNHSQVDVDLMTIVNNRVTLPPNSYNSRAVIYEKDRSPISIHPDIYKNCISPALKAEPKLIDVLFKICSEQNPLNLISY